MVEDWSIEEPTPPKPGLTPAQLAAELAEIDAVMADADAKSTAFHEKVADIEERVAIIREPEPEWDPEIPRLLSPAQLRDLQVQPRDPLLSLRGNMAATVIAERDYAMIFAERGAGKTMWELGQGLAIAAGGTHANTFAPAPRRVLLVEGEMPLSDMKGRIASFMLGMNDEQRANVEANFRLLSWEHCPDGIPSLAGEAGQQFIDLAIAEFDPAIVYLDNISCLAGAAAENDENEWAQIGAWSKSHRKDRAFVWVHHAGRNGKARGTSKREDPMDWVLFLRKPIGYTAQDGACFEAIFSKTRGRTGEAVESKTFRLHNDDTDLGRICTWNEIGREEAASKALAMKLELVLPIIQALLATNPLMKARDLRSSAREQFKEEHGVGVSDAVIDQAITTAKRGDWE